MGPGVRVSVYFCGCRGRVHTIPGVTIAQRGLPFSNGWYHLIGGMRAEQKPVADVFRFRIDGM
jgi:hypothetical protein